MLREGRTGKFRRQVAQLTFNGRAAARAGREVMFITERAVLRLEHGRLRLCEIAPGIALADVLELIGCEVDVAADLRTMAGIDLMQQQLFSTTE